MDSHPFRAAWETRDLDVWAKALAEDVVLHSPIIGTPFSGREVTELYGVLLRTLGDFDITDEYAAGDAHVFFWRADVNGRKIEGADLLRSDEHGKLFEVRVLVRPLVDIAVFAA